MSGRRSVLFCLWAFGAGACGSAAPLSGRPDAKDASGSLERPDTVDVASPADTSDSPAERPDDVADAGSNADAADDRSDAAGESIDTAVDRADAAALIIEFYRHTVAAGAARGCWIEEGGTVTCQLDLVGGDAGVRVAGIEHAVDISQGDDTGAACAVTEDGSLWCWGLDYIGDANDHPVPHLVDLTDVKQVSVGDSLFCALRADGGVWCWGVRGIPDSPDPVFAPTRVSGMGPARQVSAGNGHACAALVDGTVSCWGDLVVRPVVTVDTPDGGDAGGGAFAPGLTGVTRVLVMRSSSDYGGEWLACAVRVDASVVCWEVLSRSGIFPNGTGSPLTPMTIVLPGPIKELTYYLADCTYVLQYDYAVAPAGQVTCLDGIRCFAGPMNYSSRLVPDAGVYLTGVTEIVAGQQALCVRFADGHALCQAGSL